MSITGFLLLLLIAAICGGIGQSIAGYSLGGCLVSIVVGLIGAFIGKWLAAQLGLQHVIEIMGIPVIWASLGSALFAIAIGLITRGRRV
ncbi:GlsB/YeaQ/YmgE family stress response membrane protein [Fodinibius salsisoli]|uniref:GlsB/YeaQ/YmgE family stress response membrane protein n=1 Tax=Fodinibius salsisoli TaxID=2820877 RepID=A0ABT3PH53_9BACT|nr:GlsB/YeaQ/YmgE family stress response membrane protein [Fodinibius salsisoli]MCW9705239.1 GlsB/YeaQ/YmgE family stress response membrane protein [Fodinibius salsisoli]